MFAHIKLSMNTLLKIQIVVQAIKSVLRCEITGCDITANWSLSKHNFKEYSFAVTTKTTLLNIIQRAMA